MVLGLRFENAGAMVFLFYSFKRASRSHGKTDFWSGGGSLRGGAVQDLTGFESVFSVCFFWFVYRLCLFVSFV